MKSSGIKVEIAGGLANQIFMFLGGKWLAETHGKSLTLVCTPNEIHSEALWDFTLPHQYVISTKFNRLKIGILRKISKINPVLNRILRLMGFGFTNETGFPSSAILSKRIKFVSGYFQSYQIHNLALKGESIFDVIGYSPSKWTQDLVQDSIKPRDIAIHVRLGDYALERETIGLLGLSYYQEAIRIAIENGGSGTIRVVTNDINACQEFLAPLTYNFEYLHPPMDVPNIDSLFILSKHRFLVLANSSFSLLSALESKSPTIIRPTPWFKNLKEPEKLSPQNWIQIPSSWR
jgi:hypothetical protein